MIVRGGRVVSNVVYPFAPGLMNEVLDGTSNTLMISEKRMDVLKYLPTTAIESGNNYQDNGYVQGVAWATTRCTLNSPRPDEICSATTISPGCPGALFQTFGSAHPNGVNAVFGDAAVRSISYRVPVSIFGLMVLKSDGNTLDPTGW
jgi:hypothetical protein